MGNWKTILLDTLGIANVTKENAMKETVSIQLAAGP